MALFKKCLSYIDVEMGSVIFGIVMSIAAIMVILTCIGAFMYVNIMMFLGYNVNTVLGGRPPDEPYYTKEDAIGFVALNAGLTLCMLYLLLELSFSIVLAYGAAKKKPDHLKAYFIFGVVKSIVGPFISIILLILMWDNVPGATLLTLSIFNALMLVMVYAAYIKVKKYKLLNKFGNGISIVGEMHS